MTELVRVINTRATFLTTPKAGKPGKKGHFPAKRLVPGGNNLTAEHLAVLDGLPRSGPGKCWHMWRELGFVKALSPQESASELRKPEGPDAPPDLTERKLEAAVAIVMVEDSPEVLRAWFARDRRGEVREAIKARLTQLEGRSASVKNPEPAPKA